MSTIHGNTGEQALTRLGHCVLTAGVNLPHASIREAMALAIHLVVHIDRVDEESMQNRGAGSVSSPGAYDGRREDN